MGVLLSMKPCGHKEAPALPPILQNPNRFQGSLNFQTYDEWMNKLQKPWVQK